MNGTTPIPGTVRAPVPEELQRLLDRCRERMYTRSERVPLDQLAGWHTDPETGALRHESGGFFRVEGLRVRRPEHAVPQWDQPILNQPEIGVLGLLVRDLGGVPHCLVQLKAEPGNHNGVQLSPTVQATASNYRGVHGGRGVPYLEYFAGRTRQSPGRVLADVRQSEQGAWFLRKHNRNIIVHLGSGPAADAVPVREHFSWLPLPTLRALLAVDDLVNMDTRSVLACLPEPAVRRRAVREPAVREPADPEPESAEATAMHPDAELASWITEVRSTTDIRVEPRRLDALDAWHRDGDGIRHETGTFFEVVGVRVEAHGREVAHWSQPMLAPAGTGVVALLTTRVGGVPHVLLELCPQPGSTDIAELAPTVNCLPRNYLALPPAARPPFLDTALSAAPEQVLFDSVQSEEGGRFHHARTRHLIVRTEPLPEPPGYRWVSLPQLTSLLRHSHYVTMEARSLLSCLRSVRVPADEPAGAPR